MTGPNPADYAATATDVIRNRPGVRTAITDATVRSEQQQRDAYEAITSDAWRDWARDVKSHVLTHLDRYLEMAEERLTANGAQVHWAESAADVHAILDGIVTRRGIRRCVKGKSMLSEELDVNAALEARGVEVRETDLGEYIIQLRGEPPSHIVGPALHLSLEDCRALFHEELGTPADASAEAIAAAARAILRQDFLAADLGISGGNFLVAETGTVALIENEGNIRISTSLPPVHVALVGIEKLLPRLDDLAGFLQLTARAATGQDIGNYVSLIQGPRRPGESDGPEEVHVVLVDNGRAGLLADDAAWEALRCVRCGACLNVCPVYRQTGGHAYGWAYSGPIGAILAPGLLGLEEALPLPYASSLCGACADVCPVRIPIPDLLVYWREEAVRRGLVSQAESAAMTGFAAAATSPTLFGMTADLMRFVPWEMGGRALPVLKQWTGARTPPDPGPRTFRRMWEEGIE